MSASFQGICRPLELSWTGENQQLNINNIDVGSLWQRLGLLNLLALQFILLYTRYVFDFTCLTNSSHKLWNVKESIYTVLCCLRVTRFLAFDLRSKMVNCRSVHAEECFSWPPVCLFLASKVVNFFIYKECWRFFPCFRGELATEAGLLVKRVTA